ncbi:DNA topoisomerase III [Chromatiales bacterium (ex Bugula neritina AB1)]|nr:DNA topoisomerase III [Chromatiales bacterium (ex Bugula neritina AB1)]
MRLFIAEKPSLGRAIADVLPRPLRRSEGYITAANGDCVSWCIGHLLEQAEPHVYNPEYKSWRMQHLPIIPEQWKLQPKRETKSQLTVLRKLVADAGEIVHAGDPDREGQLLVDQVIAYLKVSAKRRSAIQRLLISDLNPAAVQRALSRLEKNTDYAALSSSALARARADWLYGINMTRAYTIQGRKVGYDGVLSVGRVQTPVLGLVVRRCEEIENFVSKPFYEVLAHLTTQAGESFTANWQPSEACQPYMDDAGRVLLKKLAENVVQRISGKQGSVQKCLKKNKKQAPPLPFSLSILQIEAARRYGMNAQQVLTVCQSLYEKHKLLTYPRSDCRYLPVEHFSQAAAVVSAIAHNHPSSKQAVANADTRLKNAAWNDSKVTAHHAIIPTARKADGSVLNTSEKQVYGLVARQYLAQFYPAHEYADTRVEILLEGGLFIANAKTVLKEGWKVLFAREVQPGKSQPKEKTLPVLIKGQSLFCNKGELLEKNTTPPAYFTDATLLAAMTGISRFVSSAEVRKILKETDGLGTEATRAGIIELLFRRGFMVRQGKQIHATDAGKGLIRALPEVASQPDMTAHWESTLDSISLREASYENFMQPLNVQLHNLIEQSGKGSLTALRGVSAPSATTERKRGGFKKKSVSKKKARSKKKISVRKKRSD